PVLPDTSGWVKRVPGDVIEAGTPYICFDGDGPTFVMSAPYEFQTATWLTYWTPPPAPREPWRDISTDRDKPTLAKVTWAVGKTSTGMYYRDDRGVYDEWRDRIGRLDSVKSVEVLRTYDPETHVPVERALIDEAARYAASFADALMDARFTTAADLIRSLASLADGADR